MFERAIKVLVGLALVLVLVFFAFAYGLYFLGARHAPDHWGPTKATFPDSIHRAWWRIEAGSDPIAIEPISPPSLLWRWLGIVARDVNAGRLPRDSELFALGQASRLGQRNSITRHHQLASWAMTIRASRWPDGRVVDTVLDQSYFGGKAYGLHAGAQRVFARPLSSLDTGEVALLIGLMRGPGYLDPWCHAERLRERMADTTAMTPAQIDRAFARLAPTRADVPCGKRRRPRRPRGVGERARTRRSSI